MARPDVPASSSDRMKQWWIDHPEARSKARERLLKRWRDPELRKDLTAKRLVVPAAPANESRSEGDDRPRFGRRRRKQTASPTGGEYDICPQCGQWFALRPSSGICCSYECGHAERRGDKPAIPPAACWLCGTETKEIGLLNGVWLCRACRIVQNQCSVYHNAKIDVKARDEMLSVLDGACSDLNNDLTDLRSFLHVTRGEARALQETTKNSRYVVKDRQLGLFREHFRRLQNRADWAFDRRDFEKAQRLRRRIRRVFRFYPPSLRRPWDEQVERAHVRAKSLWREAFALMDEIKEVGRERDRLRAELTHLRRLHTIQMQAAGLTIDMDNVGENPAFVRKLLDDAEVDRIVEEMRVREREKWERAKAEVVVA